VHELELKEKSNSNQQNSRSKRPIAIGEDYVLAITYWAED
jgi:hypothetical protein